jgi:hypothetical protein
VLTIGGISALWTVAGRGETIRAGPPAQYVDETAHSGLSHTYDGNFDFAVGGGLAAFDCNDDGRPDLYLAGGERPAALYRNDSPVDDNLRFSPLPDAVTDLGSVNGAYPIDIDGDGHVDLAVLRNGGNRLLRGLGDCQFDDATTAWTLEPGTRHTEAFSAAWESGSSWPTLAFGNYVDPLVYDDATTLDPTKWCEPNELVRPAAAGRGFGPPLPLTPSWCTLSLLFSDWSGSGRMDLRVSNDAHYYRANDGEEQLWRVVHGEAPSLYDADDGWVRVRVEGMGIASHDLTGDGRPEIYLTSQASNRLQTLAEGATGPRYVDIGLPRGANVAHPFTGTDMALPSTAWHPEFADVNNDGLIDLFVAKGNVTQQPDYATQDPSNLLLGQPDGTFLEGGGAAGILTFDRARGAALVDFNLDGRLDLVESFYGAPVKLWRNTTGDSDSDASPSTGHWLAVRLEQPAPNVDAVGAKIEVRTRYATDIRELTVGGGHGGGQLGWIHTGLGEAQAAQLRVVWPDGEIGPWLDVAADRFYGLERGATTARPWAP